MDIKSLRKEFNKLTSRIPDFIDTKSPFHKILWAQMDDANDILLTLLVNKVLSDRVINGLADRFEDAAEKLLDGCDDHLIINLSNYYINLHQWLLETTVEWELFEASSNLHRFHNISREEGDYYE